MEIKKIRCWARNGKPAALEEGTAAGGCEERHGGGQPGSRLFGINKRSSKKKRTRPRCTTQTRPQPAAQPCQPWAAPCLQASASAAGSSGLLKGLAPASHGTCWQWQQRWQQQSQFRCQKKPQAHAWTLAASPGTHRTGAPPLAHHAAPAQTGRCPRPPAAPRAMRRLPPWASRSPCGEPGSPPAPGTCRQEAAGGIERG